MNLTTLLLSLAVCLPALLWLFRFWFDGWDSFVAELGYRKEDDIYWKLIRIDLNAWLTIGKLAVLVFAPYCILAALLGHTVERLLA